MTEKEAKPHLGYYYGIHDEVLYHVTHSQGKLHLSRRTTHGPEPAQDKFCDPYEIADDQMKRLLDFSFKRAEYQPAPPAKPPKDKPRPPLSLF
jgi:hypothetical protein